METSTNAYMNDVKISSLQQERSQHVGFERLSQIKCVPTTFIILIACRPTTPPRPVESMPRAVFENTSFGRYRIKCITWYFLASAT